MSKTTFTSFIAFAVLFSVGFAGLEIRLQQYGVAPSAIAILAFIHILISTGICAYLFFRHARTPARYLWAAAFVVLGASDVMHATTMFVFPAARTMTVTILNDMLYAAFIILALVGLLTLVRRSLSMVEILVSSGIALLLGYLSLKTSSYEGAPIPQCENE